MQSEDKLSQLERVADDFRAISMEPAEVQDPSQARGFHEAFGNWLLLIAIFFRSTCFPAPTYDLHLGDAWLQDSRYALGGLLKVHYGRTMGSP